MKNICVFLVLLLISPASALAFTCPDPYDDFAVGECSNDTLGLSNILGLNPMTYSDGTVTFHRYSPPNLTSSGLGDCFAFGNADNECISSAFVGAIKSLNTTVSGKFNTPSGTTSQYVRGDGSLATLPTASAPSINDAPGRSLVTATNATGFQISSTRIADVCYEGLFQTTSTIGGPAAVTVFLETANTNSTTPGDWTTIAQQTNSNTITLAIVLQQVDNEPWSLCRKIPAGKYVRIRSGSITGTASATINSQQQETLL